MKEIPLSQTNPYLRNNEQYERMIFNNVTSSTAIEIRVITADIKKKLKEKDLPKIISLSDY